MIVEKIKHDCWVYKNIEGVEYRGRYITHGFTYAQFVIEKQTSIKKKKYFFSKLKEIFSWEEISKSNITIPLKEYYEVSDTENTFNKLILKFINTSIIVHKNRFENEVQKRDRIIDEIIK